MTARLLFIGTLQYATVQEALGADTWLSTWRNQNYGSIRPAGSGQQVMALIPPANDDPNGPAANGQLTWTLHLETDTEETGYALAAQVTGALGDGGVYAAVQNSGSGTNPE